MKKQKGIINLYDEITNKIISLLEAHILSPQKQWISIGLIRLAYNLSTDSTYQGINQLLLSFSCAEKQYAKNAWLTFNQISDLKGNILKGEKSTQIYFYNFLYLDKNGKKLNAAIYSKFTAEQLKEKEVTKKGYLKYFNVYQTENFSAELGFTKVITENVSYIKNRRSIIKNDNNFILKASSKANKAAKFINDLSAVDKAA